MYKAAILILMYLILSGLNLSGQNGDYATQPNVRTTLGAYAVDGDNLIWGLNAVLPDTKGKPQLEKWSSDGSLIWRKPLPIADCNEAWIEVLSVVDSQYFVQGTIYSDEFISFALCFMMITDSEGKIIKQRYFQGWYQNSISLIPNQFFPRVFFIENKLYLLPGLNENLIFTGFTSPNKRMNLHEDGRLFIALPNSGIGVLDPYTNTIVEVINDQIGQVNFFKFLSADQLFAIGPTMVTLMTSSGLVIHQKAHPFGNQLNGRDVFFDGDHYWYSRFSGVDLFDSLLNYTHTIANPTSDAIIHRVIQVEDKFWAMGDESTNSFLLELFKDGSFAPLTVDVSLDSVSADELLLHHNKPYEVDFSMKGVRVFARNTGIDTIHSVMVNWIEVNSIGYHTSNDFRNEELFQQHYTDLNLAPGEGNWLDVRDTTFKVRIFQPEAVTDMYINPPKVQFSLSIPNDRLDGNHLNDVLFKEVEVLNTTSISKLALNTQITTFPNPTEQQVTIQIESTVPGPATIALFNVTGQVLPLTLGEQIELQTGLNQFNLDLGYLPAGIYFLHVNQADRTSTVRIVKD